MNNREENGSQDIEIIPALQMMNCFPISDEAIIFIQSNTLYLTDIYGVIKLRKQIQYDFTGSSKVYPQLVIPKVHDGHIYLKTEVALFEFSGSSVK